MVRRLAALLLSTLALAACASPLAKDADASEAAPPEPTTLTVVTTYRHDRSWSMYREGVRVEIILRDGAGRQVDIRRTELGKAVRFEELPPGEYELEPAVRPCDANCGYLDPRLDQCSATVEVTGAVRVGVHFVVAAPCTLHDPSRAGEA